MAFQVVAPTISVVLMRQNGKADDSLHRLKMSVNNRAAGNTPGTSHTAIKLNTATFRADLEEASTGNTTNNGFINAMDD